MLQPRRSPQQSRSKERVEAILDAARELIGQQGNDAISMRTIAGRAGVPISSVYQYFPDKNAIVRALMEAYLKNVRASFTRDYDATETIRDVLATFEKSVDRYFQFFIDEPAFATIWAGVQANPTLQVLDIQDSRENASFFAQQLNRFLCEEVHQEVFDIMLFLVSMTGEISRLALFVDYAAKEMFIREVKLVIGMRLEHFFQSKGGMDTITRAAQQSEVG